MVEIKILVREVTLLPLQQSILISGLSPAMVMMRIPGQIHTQTQCTDHRHIYMYVHCSYYTLISYCSILMCAYTYTQKMEGRKEELLLVTGHFRKNNKSKKSTKTGTEYKDNEMVSRLKPNSEGISLSLFYVRQGIYHVHDMSAS